MRRYTHDASARSAASTDCGCPCGRFVDHDPRVLLDRASSGQPRVEDPKGYPDPTARQPDVVGFNSSPRGWNGVKIARYADLKQNRLMTLDAHGALAAQTTGRADI